MIEVAPDSAGIEDQQRFCQTIVSLIEVAPDSAGIETDSVPELRSCVGSKWPLIQRGLKTHVVVLADLQPSEVAPDSAGIETQVPWAWTFYRSKWPLIQRE